MAGNEQARHPLPEHFATIEEAADFWDTHDLVDYEDMTTPVEAMVHLHRRRRLVAIAPELADHISAEAHKRGVSAETLVNLWLRERLQEAQ